MEQHGYMIVKLVKTLTICLWAETKAELEDAIQDFANSGMNVKKLQIVPYYKDSAKEYVKVDGRMLQIS